MKVAKDQVEIKLQAPGVVMRQRMNFGDVSGYGKISAECFSLSAGVSTTELFVGLDGDMCQCPHWGYVLRGYIVTTDGEGREETVEPGDLFYWPPGHNVCVEEDAEIILFSPQHEHNVVFDHMQAKMSA